MLNQTFLAITIFLQFALALLDHIITGVLAKGLPPDGRFHAYSLSIILVLIPFAALAAFTEQIPLIACLKVWTIFLLWVGGGLDWIYFLAGGELPSWNFVWHWMPKIIPTVSFGKLTFTHPTTFHWGLYTAFMWIPNIFCWGLVL